MTDLHLRLSELAHRLRILGEEDLARWIQKHIAAEQRSARRPRGEPKKKVRLAKTGQEAWIPTRMIEKDTDE